MRGMRGGLKQQRPFDPLLSADLDGNSRTRSVFASKLRLCTLQIKSMNQCITELVGWSQQVTMAVAAKNI
jgi:hypothetical protein